ncbi:TIGR02996 domain-containing protein [Urbifossiella limnaea]|uniref:Uncharacterized protein n=1 Tax=Urbifossiella limnaea TaxID=2528023 RepID=A0A517XQF4_9BACT|nr:TIGR02996 domain-containing protein [Urbifossiella limnaea]QDU19733.1 hypothetical protein ETAA1_16690 [Urbifossiella limnaea]
MSDLDALVAAALGRPGDETPRLVLADWLDDHDHPDRALVLRLPGWWAVVPTVVARGLYRYPTTPRARYLVWQPDAVRRPELLPHARDPACVVATVRRGAARRAGVVCHCGAAGGMLEFTGGAWHCTAVCPPSEDCRAVWEADRRAYLAAAADRLLPGV